MKNLVLLLTLLGFVMFGCASVQQTVTPATPLEVQQVLDTPTIWRQSLYKSISLKDSVLFYNSYEIKLEGNFFKQSVFIQNGVVNSVDSITDVLRTVPVLTPGGLIEMKKNSMGEIMGMLVSFSRNNCNYHFVFNKKTSGSFTLNGKAELIFNSRIYPVTAITTGDCILLFFYHKQVVKLEDKQSAEGWKNNNEQ